MRLRQLNLNKRQYRKMAEVYKYIAQAIVTIIIVLIGMIIMRHNQPPAIAKVDLVAITTHYTAMMAKDTLGSNGANSKKISDVIKTNLEPIISNYAKAHNVVVIQSQALVDGNVIDITNSVISQLDKKLN